MSNEELIENSEAWCQILCNSKQLPSSTLHNIANCIRDLVELVSVMDTEIERLKNAKKDKKDTETQKQLLDLELIIAEKNRLITELKEMNSNQTKIIYSYEKHYNKKVYDPKKYFVSHDIDGDDDENIDVTIPDSGTDYALKA